MRDVRIFFRHGDDVALVDLRVEAEQKIGRAEQEEVQRMRLHDLTVMHEPAHLLGAQGRRRGAHYMVHRLGGGDLVRHRADAAEALHHDRRLPIGTALHEFLEAAEFDDVQPRLMHAVVRVEEQRDLAMAFDA